MRGREPLSFRQEKDFKGRPKSDVNLQVELVKSEIATIEAQVSAFRVREQALLDIVQRIYVRVEEILSGIHTTVKLTTDKELRTINKELRALLAS